MVWQLKRVSAWGQRLQSNVIFPAARTIYMIVAASCFIGIVGGVVVAAYFRVQTIIPVRETPLPPTFEPKQIVLNYDAVSARLAPPKNIHFQQALPIIPVSEPLTETMPLGIFEADSANPPAPPHSAFQIVGGKDAEFIRYVSAPGMGRGALVATRLFVDSFNLARSDVKSAEKRVLNLQVIARDAFGNTSEPENVSVTLIYGPIPKNEAEKKEAYVPAQDSNVVKGLPDDMQILARDIATTLDPQKTPKYFESYANALNVSKQCGKGDSEFTINFRKAFDLTKSKLTQANIGAFYVGLCGAWTQALQERQKMRADAEAARQRVEMENQAERQNAKFKHTAYASASFLSLMVAAGALGIFLTTSIFLAFLAIEKHTKALHEAIHLLAQQKNHEDA